MGRTYEAWAKGAPGAEIFPPTVRDTRADCPIRRETLFLTDSSH